MNRDPARQRAAADAIDRTGIIDRNFIDAVRGWEPDAAAAAPPSRDDDTPPLDSEAITALLDSQMRSRHLDFVARALRARGEGFYTIGSAGHEPNAVVARLTRATDPAFLHYRSGAFMLERARARADIDGVYDTALSLCASREDPIAGGRHKVWGSAPLWVLPQTSTIASHLPKALGMAIAIDHAARLGRTPPVPGDSIVVASLGDASVNHSTAVGALNAAAWSTHQGIAVPLLLVCEDNGWGISVRTPAGWIERQYSTRPGLRYFSADGTDPEALWAATAAAVRHCRQRRRPAFLHLRLERLLGHAGTDVESAYREIADIEAVEARDPLIAMALFALARGAWDPAGLLARYEVLRTEVTEAAERAARRPRLAGAFEVMAPLAPYTHAAVAEEAGQDQWGAGRETVHGGQLPEDGEPRPLAVQINRALHDLLFRYPEALLFGEDVARKGGVYNVTPGLLARFGPARVFNTLLDEQTILGLAQGCAFAGLLPIAEIQYLAYVHNAIDQLRGEACSTQFFSRGQFRNPMIVRVAGLGYQRGFGGHFHNDNSIAALRDIPGLVIACPSRGDDAAGMLRTCAALARVDGRVIVFLEPIALYGTRDLHEAGDREWSFPYPPPGEAVAFGAERVYNPVATRLCVLTFGNGVYLTLRALRSLGPDAIAGVRVVDLRWLAPLNVEAVAAHARDCPRVLVVDEGRRSGGLGEALVTSIIERVRPLPAIARIAGEDSYIPLGAAARDVLPDEAGIAAAIDSMLAGREPDTAR